MLAKYFPLDKTAKLRSEVFAFAQLDKETLFDAWECFTNLLRRCRYHEPPKWCQIHIFYNGLHFSSKSILDFTAGGSLMRKTPEEAFELKELMAENNY